MVCDAHPRTIHRMAVMWRLRALTLVLTAAAVLDRHSIGSCSSAEKALVEVCGFGGRNGSFLTGQVSFLAAKAGIASTNWHC